MPPPPNSPWFDLLNNIWWWVQFMKLPIVLLSPFSRYIILLRARYSLQHPVSTRGHKCYLMKRNVQTINYLTFQECLLPPSSGRWLNRLRRRELRYGKEGGRKAEAWQKNGDEELGKNKKAKRNFLENSQLHNCRRENLKSHPLCYFVNVRRNHATQ
jgi:hypothetical protein